MRNKKGFRGVRGHAPPENFWKFTCCNGYFSAFWIIFTQILLKFFDPSFECFAKYDAFFSPIFDYACLRRKTYCYRRSSKLRKNCVHQKVFENGWWEGACPSSYPPWSAPGHKPQKPYIFQSLGTTNFALFTKRWDQKGEAWHNASPKYAPVCQQSIKVLALKFGSKLPNCE